MSNSRATGQVLARVQHSEEVIEDLVVHAQSGDQKVREALLKNYHPFIAKSASKVCKRYIDMHRDDEFSIALQGFNEAIDHFSPSHNRSFLSFAETVMTRRLIDFIRKEQRFTRQLPLSSYDVLDEEEMGINPVEIQESMRRYEVEQEREARKQEILQYAAQLEEFGISFRELVKLSPKHRDSRMMLQKVARELARSPELVQTLLEKKSLPIQALLEKVEVSRKTLERHRKYIIAMGLVYIFDYPHLREYLNP